MQLLAFNSMWWNRGKIVTVGKYAVWNRSEPSMNRWWPPPTMLFMWRIVRPEILRLRFRAVSCVSSSGEVRCAAGFVHFPAAGIGHGMEMLIIIALSVFNKAKRIDF
jgi:hypothetical protein